MSVKQSEENFIFKRSHRRLTFVSVLALLPLALTYIAAVLIWLSDIVIAEQVLEAIISLPSWVLAIAWIVLPIGTIYLSHQGRKRGTLHGLRSWNQFVLRIALALLIGEVLVVLAQLVR